MLGIVFLLGEGDFQLEVETFQVGGGLSLQRR